MSSQIDLGTLTVIFIFSVSSQLHHTPTLVGSRVWNWRCTSSLQV